jgi:endonuclease YncB( thermonuclease family)
MMAATILCLVANVPDGTTIVCSDNTHIRIAGLEAGDLVPKKARGILAQLTEGHKLSCLPAGNEGAFIVAKCTLPDRRDLACTLIRSKAAVRSDVAWQRYGLEECES